MSGTQSKSATVGVDTKKTSTAKVSGIKRTREDEILSDYKARLAAKYGIVSKKETKEALRVNRKKLRVCLQSLQRHFELEVSREVDQDAVGTLGFMEKGKFLGCPISAVQYLLEWKEVDFVNEESDVKNFAESEYGLISEFPSQLERLGNKFLEAAKLARLANFGDVQPGDTEYEYTGDESEEDEDSEESEEDEENEENDDE